ncbi:MAG TPA: DUF885 domain-containing protein [Gammaproteobacteria bacterium]|nr:DUF885 domain-containing protein [Gammaproteobacteria bacterium]
MYNRLFAFYLIFAMTAQVQAADVRADRQFETLGAKYVDEFPAFNPVSATQLGDHRFDAELDEINSRATKRRIAFVKDIRAELDDIDRDELSAANKVDAELLDNELEYSLWQLETLKSWTWNPTFYTDLAGSAIYGLLARDFAPLPERLANAGSRLEKMPRLLEQARDALEPARVPKIHAETAIKQNPGVLSIIDAMIVPQLATLAAGERKRVGAAVEKAREAVGEHQEWLEEKLLPKAEGGFRAGAELFDARLRYTLHSPLTRLEIRDRAEREYQRVREAMYEVASEVYAKEYPHTIFPAAPDETYRQAIVRAALEVAYAQRPGRDEIVETAKQDLAETTEFVREHDLVTMPDTPIEIIIMPEFQRGVAVAYCDSPGPLDAGQETFYAVAPLPEDWSEEQVRSFLREYNLLSIKELTIHEAMPGHYLQLAHSNQYPSTLRAVLASGPFIEGWAVYAERMMIEAGYMDKDPLMRLINLKWYLRAVTNAIIDQAIHVDGMERDEAMQLMIEGGFQEESEAAGKWVRAQLSFGQLSTYFVGYQEHADLRREVEQMWGEHFALKRYHDEVLSYGSPPVQFVRALMLDKPVPSGP